MRIPIAVCVSVFFASSLPLLAADVGIRVTVPLGDRRTCDSPKSVAMLGDAYYREPAAELTETVEHILSACHIAGEIRVRYLVVVFPAAEVPGAKLSLVHAVYDAADGRVLGSPVLLGVRSAQWLYLTDQPSDLPVVQLSIVPAQNPLLGQLGKLASTVIPKFKGQAEERPPQTYPVAFFLSQPVQLPTNRSTVSETDVVGQIDPKHPIEGSATFINQPRTWLTVNAGAGIFAGRTKGAIRAKIDSKTYVSDPPGRAATFAGVTFHAPFDGNRPTPSAAEQWGIVLAAVLTPDFGVYIGPSYGWRGLSFTAGWAATWVNVPPRSKQINDAVEDHEMLRTARSGRLLIAASYGFGG